MSQEHPEEKDSSFARALTIAFVVIGLVALPAVLFLSVGSNEPAHRAAWKFVERFRRNDPRAIELATGSLVSVVRECMGTHCLGSGPTGEALELLRHGALQFGGTTGASRHARCFEGSVRANQGGASRSVRFHVTERSGRWTVDEVSTTGDCRD